MTILSGGVLVKTPSQVVWTGSPSSWPSSLELNGWWASFSALYRQQLWVSVVVNKISAGTARLPLKVYRRTADGREEVRDHPYAELLRQPNRKHDPFFFWLWTVSTLNIYGDSFWGKVRDRGGRPVELLPLHPQAMSIKDETSADIRWRFDNGLVAVDNIPESDLVHFRTYNPDSMLRGMSPLEPLRRTLENEDAARRATSAFWRNGARPATVLSHPKRLTDQKMRDRLKAEWDSIHGGVDNFAKTAILEEGMKPETLSLSAEEAQYVETRKLNREEVCAAYDIPPPVVHILDHATFSNITEQMRSMYRDTMAPRLKLLESALEMQLRASARSTATEPDFGDDVYAEFLMDEVLRGDFEERATAKQAAINSGQLTPNEGRKLENLPPLEGGDTLFINSTMVPVTTAAEPPQPALPSDQARALMGRLSRQKTLDDVDLDVLVEGLNGAADDVRAAYWSAKAAGEDVAGLRARLKELA